MARLPRISVPLKADGFVIGTVEINPNGTFTGEIRLGILHEELVLALEDGSIRALEVGFETVRKQKMGIDGVRNLFEDNESEVSHPEAAEELGNKLHVRLPPLSEGHHYKLTKLSNGETAVVVEGDGEESGERTPFGSPEEIELRHRDC